MIHLYIFSTVEIAFHIPSKSFNVVCCVVDPKMLLTVIRAVYTVPACSPMM